MQGHEDVVLALIEAGANVDKKDRNQWTALMWAMTNRHKNIAKMLLDHGASSTIKSSSGRTAFDLPAPNSEISDFLHQSGYHIGDVGVEVDFYDNGFSQDRFEQEMEENEMRRRMMMESSMNLEVDLSSLGMDERPEVGQIIYRNPVHLLKQFSRLMKPKSSRTLFGTIVSMIRCSSFRKAS